MNKIITFLIFLLSEISFYKDTSISVLVAASLNYNGIPSLSQGPPVVSTSAAKRKKGGKSKRKDEFSSIGELLILPFLSKFPLPLNISDIQCAYK